MNSKADTVVVPVKPPKPRAPIIPTKVQRDRKKHPRRQPKHRAARTPAARF